MTGEAWLVVVVVGVATVMLKASGPVLLTSGLPPAFARVVDLLAPALLAALVATQALTESSELVIDERAAGMVAAGVAITVRAPVLVTVIAAATVTAALRAL